GIQTKRGVGQHRKKSDDPGADNDRGLLRQVNQQQRRNRDHRRDLQDHRIGEQRIFQPFRLIEQQRQRDAADGGGNKSFERRQQRGQQRLRQHRPIADERPKH